MSNVRFLRVLAGALFCFSAAATSSAEPVGALPGRLPFASPSAQAANSFIGHRPLAVHPRGDSLLVALGSPLAWLEQKIAADDGQSSDLFGFRTLVVGDTAFVSVPAPGPRAGSVCIYTRGPDGWTLSQRISATPPAGTPPNWSDFFGWSLAVSGDRLLVGAPEVFDPMNGPAGGAFLFTRGGDGQWMQTATFLPSIPGTLDWYGEAVAMAGDTVLIGEQIYDRNGPESRGATHVFNEVDGVWTETQTVEASDGAQNDGRNFGGAIAASADGATVVIGSPGPDWSSSGYPDGAAYVFSNSDGVLTETGKLEASDTVAGNQFGFSVALDGTRLLVGAPASTIGSNVGQGAAYVFDATGGAFVQTQKLFDASGEMYDQFGQAVDLSGGLAVIGMWHHNDDLGGTQPPPKAGTVHVYDASGATWSPLSSLSASDAPADEDNSFGWDVTVDGNTILVGADSDSSVGMFQGSAYFYTRDTIFADSFDGAP
jgi:hypothetical protein